MWQFLCALLILAAVAVAVKAAILLLFLAGLIFRPRNTVGLIVIAMVIAAIAAYPIACVTAAVLTFLFGLYRHRVGG